MHRNTSRSRWLGLLSALVFITCAHSYGAPTYEAIRKEYSATKAPNGFKEFCSKHGNPNANTCAIRLASALQDAESRFFANQKPKSGIAWEGLPTRASDLAIILNKKLGKAQTIKDSKTKFDRKQLPGKKGIIFFDTIEEYDGTGHISLWDGSGVVDGGEYFDRSPRVYLWSLP